MSRELEITRIKKDWSENPRWNGVKRGYTAEDVFRLRGSLQVEHTLARRGSEKLWSLMQTKRCVDRRGASPGRANPCPRRFGEALEPDAHEAVRKLPGRAHRQPGDAAGARRRP